MPKKYINRYQSFVKSLDALERVRTRDLTDEFVISGTVQKFGLTMDIAWKVMKDIIVNYHKVTSFASGSPRETLRTAASVGLISDDIWMQMLEDRNALTHDYDGSLAASSVERIVRDYIPVFEAFRAEADKYIRLMEQEERG